MKYLLLSILLISCSKSDAPILHSKNVSNDISNTDIEMIISYGQSLSDGGDGGVPNQVISTQQLYNSLMFNLGVRSMDFNGKTPTSFVPLIENVSRNTVMGETPCSGASDMFIQSYSATRNFQLMACASGQPSQTIAELSKGTQYYQRLITDVTNAYNIATGMGKTFSVKSIFWIQGEADYTAGTSYNDYYNALVKLINDLNADIDSITGQTNQIIFLATQCASQNRTTSGMNNPIVDLAESNLSAINPYFIISTPMYQFNYLSDNTHLSDTNYYRLGAYLGKSLSTFMQSGTKNYIYPISHQVLANNTVTITFNVPVQPLVFDTTSIKFIDAYGFSAKDALGNSIKIKNVSFLSGNMIQLILSKMPSTISYGINGALKKAGNQNGARGNVRDVQQDSINGYPLYNYMSIFSFNL
jgi:hypothetical protein